jgi:hypothetical protein
MKNKEGLLYNLASSLAITYTDILHGRDPAVMLWDDLEPQERDHCIAAMMQALPQAIDQELPDSVPTRAHLRSHLSTQIYGQGVLHASASITGFDDLYEDVLLSVKLAKTSGEFDAFYLQNHLDEVNLELDNTCDKLAAVEEELRDMESSRDYERGQRNGNRTWAIEAEEKLIKANKRIAELEEECKEDGDEEQERESTLYNSQVKLSHERAVSQSYRNILDRIATVCGVTYGDGDELVKTIVKARQVGEKLKEEVAELTKRNADQESKMRKLKLEIESILEEFQLHCPTDDVLDMVRCACEGGRDLIDRNKFLEDSIYFVSCQEMCGQDKAEAAPVPPCEEPPLAYKSSNQSSVWPVCVTIIVCTMVPFTAWFIGELIKA